MQAPPKSEEDLSATFEQAAIGIAHVGLDKRWLRVNRRLCDILGRPSDVLLASGLRDIIHPEDLAADHLSMQRLLAGEIATYSAEKRHLFADGGIGWLSLAVSLVRTESGGPDYFLYVIEDISGRKKNEALMAGQQQVLEMIARGAALPDTLAMLLRVIEAQSTEMLCSILLLDADGVHLRHGAAPSLPQAYMDAIDGSAIGAQAGSCGTAAFRHQAVFVEDIAQNPLWIDYRELALRFNLRACWSTPIFDAQRRMLGTFAIYYRSPGLPGKRHLELIEVATHLAAIAIGRKQTEVDREHLLNDVEATRREAVAARDLLSSVFSRMNDGIVALDSNWRYVYINQNAVELLNRGKPEDLIGKHIWTEYPEGIDQHFGKAYRQAMDTQRVVYLEDYYEPWDRWFENRIYPSPDGLTIYFTEITERKRAERALRAERTLLDQVTACSPVGILAMNAQGQISLVNQTAAEILGVGKEQILQRGYMSPEWKVADIEGALVPPEQLPFARVKSDGKPIFDAEYFVEKPDGKRVLLSVNAAPLLDDAGHMEGVVLAMADIGERRQVMETLRASEQKFGVAFRSSPDAITITSVATGLIVDINEAGIRLTGYRREELLGHSTTKLNLWGNQEDRDRYVATLGKQGRVMDLQTEFRKKGGEIRIGLVSGEMIEIDGKPHILGVIRDITEQKRAEAEILKLNAELEQRVAERTEQLETANKELEAFSYLVSHNLKAPLRGIDGYSQLLQENHGAILNEEGQLFLRNIRSGAAQMHDLIEDLLAYARMERRSMGNGAIDLRACVEEAVLGYRREIDEQAVQLRSDVPAFSVQADREGLAIVLRNLLDNALKFSRGARPPIIDIQARAEGNKIILLVRDNGIGFDMKFHERIFDVFSRLQRSEDYAGTGVGLALVRKAMVRMGGRVWAESAAGQGATFFLELKRVPS